MSFKSAVQLEREKYEKRLERPDLSIEKLAEKTRGQIEMGFQKTLCQIKNTSKEEQKNIKLKEN